MSAGAITFLVLFAIAAGAAIIFGVRMGKLAGDLKVASKASKDAIKAAKDSQEAADERISRADQVIATYKAKVRSLRDELNQCGDPETRSRLAVDSITSMLADLQD